MLDVSLQLKRKPGQSDVDRTLGSVEQKYRKLKTTDTPAAESQVSLTIDPIINLTGSFEWQSAEEFFFSLQNLKLDLYSQKRYDLFILIPWLGFFGRGSLNCIKCG